MPLESFGSAHNAAYASFCILFIRKYLKKCHQLAASHKLSMKYAHTEGGSEREEDREIEKEREREGDRVEYTSN